MARSGQKMSRLAHHSAGGTVVEKLNDNLGELEESRLSG